MYADVGVSLAQVLGKMLGTINAAMLTACTAETDHKAGEAPADEPLYVVLRQRIYMAEESEYLAVILKEADDLGVKAREVLVLSIATGIMGGAAVKDVTAAIAGRVFGQSPLVAKAGDGDG